MATDKACAPNGAHPEDQRGSGPRGIINIEQLLPPGYAPVSELWQSPTPAFSNEHNGRWFLRRHGARLVDLHAIVVVGGRLYFHRERWPTAVEQLGAEDAAERFRRGAAAAAPGATLQAR